MNTPQAGSQERLTYRLGMIHSTRRQRKFGTKKFEFERVRKKFRKYQPAAQQALAATPAELGLERPLEAESQEQLVAKCKGLVLLLKAQGVHRKDLHVHLSGETKSVQLEIRRLI